MLPHLLDPENEHDYRWADSAYSGECFEELLKLGKLESLIHEKGARNHPLSDAAKKLNRIKSAIRACVEHVFGCMTMSMGGKLTRKIGIERNEAWWDLKNLTFSFLGFLQRSDHITVVAWLLLRGYHNSSDIVNGRCENFLLCRLIGGFFMTAEALQSAYFSRCP
jgi:hypothetical protein